ncbi:flagellar biosynthesis anti-sigma factor FlgM [Sedimentibacter sp.]|uniref:flagellar biosynthesis anti-sigma factor FlgM n=1 Tax=Sedimentibacter sp. TaxID=1960295 RepID=UPI00289F70AE|nr:flagellar biosynthesis anti-sigma factor FlgM [Sedimentibacter sp.]
MKIQNINNYMNYTGASKPVKNHESVKNNKYDVIELNGKASMEKNEGYLNSIKKNITADVSKENSAEKINRIKESIDNKTYDINAEEIVRKLFI